MKKIRLNTIINIVLLLVVVFVVIFQKRYNQAPSTVEVQSDAISIIHQRKSVRNFVHQKEVRRADIENLMRAGMAAPSAVNKQPWAFIAIDDRSILDTLCAQLPYAKMLADASAAIVVCGNLSKTLDGPGQEFWIQDCSAATQNILLAAEAMGLGAVWTATYPDPARIQSVVQALQLPSDIIPLCVIPIGHPTGVDKPKDKYKPENIHWNAWSQE